MTTAACVALLLLAETVFFGFAVVHPHVFRFRHLVTINFLLVTLFSPLLMSVGPYVTNITSIPYVSLFLFQLVTIERYGLDAAVETIKTALFGVLAAIVLVFVLSLFPTDNPSDAIIAAIADHPHRAVASLVAFWLSQTILVILYPVLRLQGWWPVATGAIVLLACQLVDSVLFYPMAFAHRYGFWHIIEIGTTGFMSKLVIGIVMLPLIYGVLCALRYDDRLAKQEDR